MPAIREKVSALELGDVEVQGIGQPSDVLIRVATQPGGDAAQQAVVQKVQAALGSADYEYRRVEVVGPRVSGELAWTGTIALVFTIVGIMIYIWFRFEWQFAVGAVATLVHDAVLTIGFFALTQIDFNLSSIAAILTILGYSLNDTVVIFDRIRELLRRYKQMPLSELIDLATNQTLARTIMTSLTTLLALFALYFFGGEVIRSFTAAMMWGVFVATASSIFIGGPILIYFNLRPKAEPARGAAQAKRAGQARQGLKMSESGGGFLMTPARFPGRAPIDAYGNGGFRFADMSHRGSILALPSGIEAWAAKSAAEIDPASLSRILDEAAAIEILLIGTGPEMQLLSREARAALAAANLEPELMATGAAVRTFNVLLSEERAVAAALIAVESVR